MALLAGRFEKNPGPPPPSREPTAGTLIATQSFSSIVVARLRPTGGDAPEMNYFAKPNQSKLRAFPVPSPLPPHCQARFRLAVISTLNNCKVRSGQVLLRSTRGPSMGTQTPREPNAQAHTLGRSLGPLSPMATGSTLHEDIPSGTGGESKGKGLHAHAETCVNHLRSLARVSLTATASTE